MHFERLGDHSIGYALVSACLNGWSLLAANTLQHDAERMGSKPSPISTQTGIRKRTEVSSSERRHSQHDSFAPDCPRRLDWHRGPCPLLDRMEGGRSFQRQMTKPARYLVVRSPHALPEAGDDCPVFRVMDTHRGLPATMHEFRGRDLLVGLTLPEAEAWQIIKERNPDPVVKYEDLPR